MPTFDSAGALKAGFSQDQINQFLQMQGMASPSAATQATAPVQPAQQSPLSQSPITSGILKSILDPFQKFGGGLGNALASLTNQGYTQQTQNQNSQNAQGFIDLAKQAAKKGDTKRANALFQAADQSIGQNQAQANTDIQQAQQGKSDVFKGGLGVASYAIPFGQGAGLLQKALLPGLVAGGLQSASQDNATADSIVKGSLLGGASAGLLQGILGKLAPAASSAGEKLDAAGNQLLESQYASVPKALRQKLNLSNTVDQLAQYGVKNIHDVIPTAEKVTGDTGVITDLTRNAVSKAGRVNTDNLVSLAENLSQDPLIPHGQDEKFVSFIKKGLANITDNQSTNISDAVTGNPEKTFDFIKQLEKQASSITKGKSAALLSGNDQALASSYRTFADELKTRLFSGAGADNAAIDLVKNPEYLDKLRAISPKLAEAAQKAENIGKLRSLAAPFVKGSQLAEAASNTPKKLFNLFDILSAGGGLMKGGPLGAAGALVAEKALTSPAAANMASEGLTRTGSLLSGLAPSLANKGVGYVSGQLASKVPSIVSGSKGLPQQDTNANNGSNENTTQQITNQLAPPENTNNTGSVSQSSRITKEQLAAAQLYLPPALAERVKAAYEAQLGTAGQQELALSREKVAPALNQLESDFNSGNLAQGKAGGALSQILAAGGLKPDVKIYEDSRKTIAPLIAKALGNMGNLTAQEQANAINLLPTSSSTPEEARLGFEKLRVLLGLPTYANK